MLFLQKRIAMGEHIEPEQNEITGPVIFAIMLAATVVIAIYFLSR